MLMKKLLCTSLFFLFTISAIGQDAQYSNFMFGQMAYNPGFTGSSDMVIINALNKNQWMGFGDGSQRRSLFSANAPFNILGMTHGVGIIVNNDKQALTNDLGFQVAYAYQRKMAIGDGRLGIGFSFGLNNSTFNISGLGNTDDPLVPKNAAAMNIFDMGIGVFYKSEKIYMGLSSTHLIHGERDYMAAQGGDVMPLGRHYYITAGYNYQLPNPMFMLVPSFLVQSDGSTTTLNFNTNVIYNNRIWGGFSYRAGTAVTALFGLELLAGIKFGVAYDYETTLLNKATSGSIEVVVIYGFKLKKEKIPQRYKSIRFL
jgi:type IX secretion system PorP/SprF family membrane protein